MTLDELREETVILMQEGAGVRQIVEDALRKRGVRLRDLDVRLELGLQESVRRAVEAGFGVTFISRTASSPSSRTAVSPRRVSRASTRRARSRSPPRPGELAPASRRRSWSSRSSASAS